VDEVVSAHGCVLRMHLAPEFGVLSSPLTKVTDIENAAIVVGYYSRSHEYSTTLCPYTKPLQALTERLATSYLRPAQLQLRRHGKQ